MTDARTIAAAAVELGVSTSTVRRWIREGAPCVSPGRAGRGNGARVHVATLRAWAGLGDSAEVAKRAAAIDAVPELLARATWSIWLDEIAPGERAWQRFAIDARPAAALLAYTWYQLVLALRDHCDVSEPLAFPRQIEHLRSVCASPDTVMRGCTGTTDDD
jgi:MerR HTH family regulatory protein